MSSRKNTAMIGAERSKIKSNCSAHVETKMKRIKKIFVKVLSAHPSTLNQPVVSAKFLAIRAQTIQTV